MYSAKTPDNFIKRSMNKSTNFGKSPDKICEFHQEIALKKIHKFY